MRTCAVYEPLSNFKKIKECRRKNSKERRYGLSM